MLQLVPWSKSSTPDLYKEQIREIFFLSSSKNFDTPEAKEKFYSRWLEPYLTQYADWVYIAVKDSQCIAYCTLCPDSSSAATLAQYIPGYETYRDQFHNYPAHLHINTHPKFRGLGIGKTLIEYIEQELIGKKIHGVHIVTSPDAKNTSFYSSLQFSERLPRDYDGYKLLFMGKKLIS